MEPNNQTSKINDLSEVNITEAAVETANGPHQEAQHSQSKEDKEVSS